MKKPLDWYHSLIYANKERSEYTMEEKGSLDELLYQMYMKAEFFQFFFLGCSCCSKECRDRNLLFLPRKLLLRKAVRAWTELLQLELSG